MKLPPLALTAPTLCPRCDAPATILDHCIQCALPLRQCGACRGTAGPFDRFCGFCGFELVKGKRRSRRHWWWLTVLIPVAAGLVYAAWSTGRLGGLGSASAVSSMATYQAPTLGFEYAVPDAWTQPVDYSRASAASSSSIPFVIAGQNSADIAAAAAAGANLELLQPSQAVISIGRPNLQGSLAGATEPAALLSAQLAPMVNSPPPGVAIKVVSGVRSLTVGGRRAAQVLLEITQSGSSGGAYYFQETLVDGTPSASGSLLQVEAVAQASVFSREASSIAAVTSSVRFG